MAFWLGTGVDEQYHPFGINRAEPNAAERIKLAARMLGPEGIGFENCMVVMSLARDNWSPVDDMGITRDTWDVIDQTLAAVTAAGMTPTLKVMQWMPAVASEGRPAYLRNEYGPWAHHPTWPGNGGWHVYGECADPPPNKLCPTCAAAPARVALMNNPPKPDPAWWFKAGQRVANRYGEIVQEHAIINEWDERLFSPEIRLANKGLKTRAQAFEPYHVIRSNFQAGVRSVQPGARFVGPEAAYFGGFEQALMDQQSAGEEQFQVASFHAYAPGGTFPHGTIDRIENEFMATFRKYIGPRVFNDRFRITEIDDGDTTGDLEDDADRMIEFLGDCEKYPQLDGINLSGMEPRYFTQWPPKDLRMPELTPMGQALKFFNAESRRKGPDVADDLAQIEASVAAIRRKLAE